MSDINKEQRAWVARLLTAACVALAGCASPAFVKEKVESSTPLAEARDGRIHAAIETVILFPRNGHKIHDVNSDEYLIRIRALSDEPVQIREVAVFDALDHRIESRTPPGFCAPSPWLLPALWPVALVGTVACIEYRSEILRRRTTLPVDLPRGAETIVDLFFPVTLQSGRAQVVYADRHGEHRLDIDTRQALIVAGPPMLVSRVDPGFPDEASERGIDRGWVKALLTLDKQGRVQAVEVMESWPRYVFDEEARRTFQRWTYTEGLEDGRTVVAALQFKR